MPHWKQTVIYPIYAPALWERAADTESWRGKQVAFADGKRKSYPLYGYVWLWRAYKQTDKVNAPRILRKDAVTKRMHQDRNLVYLRISYYTLQECKPTPMKKRN